MLLCLAPSILFACYSTLKQPVFVSPVLRHAGFHLAVNMCKLNLRFLAAYRAVCVVTRAIL